MHMQRRFSFLDRFSDEFSLSNEPYKLNPSAKPETTYIYLFLVLLLSRDAHSHTGRCFHFRGKKCCKMMLKINLSTAAGRAPDYSQNELNLIFF